MGITPEQQEALDLVDKYGSPAAAAKATGINRKAISCRLARAKKWTGADPSFQAAATAGGIEDVSQISHMWKIAKDEDGNGYSIFLKNPDAGSDISLTDMVRQGIEEAMTKPKKYPKRQKPKGKNLLIIDLADVHFLKLCVKTETGYDYSSKVAIARVIEGTKALLKMASGFEIGRILFVLGNDILHVDGAKPKTTSGTDQDTSGTIFQGYKDAKKALVHAIELCAEVADVDLIHCMSNHDWVMGWALSQSVGALFEKHPHVHSTDYNLSEAHRKYYRYGSNLFGLTHGDGAKEEKLYGLMVKEARQHISECPNLYWLCHHVHHKIRNRRGVDVFQAEKDHNGMTAMKFGATHTEGSHINIEYVRSPSPPDSWHDRQGYVNRQGVECFIYHPHDGQKVRLTEWF